MTRSPLRIALLTHSTNPRGGVVHALALADALTDLGHHVVVHGPDPQGTGFFRSTHCQTCGVPVRPAGPTTHDLVEAKIADYGAYFAEPANRTFDIFHAQDGISGNALADLKARGLIPGFLRTVHHIDSFSDPRLAALQNRAIIHADGLLVVSRAGQAAFSAEWQALGLSTEQVILAGAIAQGDMPALYRLATALVFPSLHEGFGLVALEALACGTPAIVSNRPPFTEHFGPDDVLWCDPLSPATIAAAMIRALADDHHAGRAEALLARHDWMAVAGAHLPLYQQLHEVPHARNAFHHSLA